MADGGVNINQVIKDSDEIEEISCEQCEKYIGKYIVATGLCLQCTEYMCSTCIEYHARYMPGHRIQNKSNMPQDICNVKCPNHSDKVIKFYCSACDKFACVICKTIQHNSCIAIAHLPAIVRDIENSKELNALEDVIEEISTDICKTNQQLVTNKNFVTNVEDTARSVVNEHQHRLVETYNKLQHESIEEFDKKMREIIEKLQTERREKIEAVTMKENQFKKKIDMAACREMRIVEEITNGEREKLSGLSKQNEAISTKIQSVKSDIELKKKTQQRCKLFMAMKAAEKQIDELKQSMCALRTNTEVQVQPFRIELNKIEMTIDQLDIRRSFFALKHIHVSNREKAVTYLYTLKLQQFEATSMCLLTKTQLLVADEKKESVLNFTDIDYRKDNFRVIKTSSKPAMVAKFAENEAVVTLPYLGLVTFLIFFKLFQVTYKDRRHQSQSKLSRYCMLPRKTCCFFPQTSKN